MTRNGNVFAYDPQKEQLVYIDEAIKGIEYLCADKECRKPVFFRRGKINQHHFAHNISTDTERCVSNNGGECKEHYDAKHHIEQHLQEYAFIVEECTDCKKQKYFTGIYGYVRAKVEGLIQGCKRIADVLVYEDICGIRRIIAAIEVFHTHRVDDEKRGELQALNVPIIEVKATDVLEERKSDVAKNRSGLKYMIHTMDCNYTLCSRCKAKHQECDRLSLERSIRQRAELERCERQRQEECKRRTAELERCERQRQEECKRRTAELKKEDRLRQEELNRKTERDRLERDRLREEERKREMAEEEMRRLTAMQKKRMEAIRQAEHDDEQYHRQTKLEKVKDREMIIRREQLKQMKLGTFAKGTNDIRGFFK
jgi:flagellar biosynthesis GTPase FlhF